MAEQVDLETLSLDELRKLAFDEAAQQQTTTTQTTKPRDEQGRFLAQAAQTEEEAGDEEEQEEEDEQPKLFRRVITIGEGVDPEVFEAASMEELIDKIADAKAHATRKIREQGEQLRKSKESETAKTRQFTEDEEFVLSQELMNKPTQAVAKIFKEMVGMDISAFKTVAQKVEAFEKGKQTNDAIATFLTTHPEYEDSQRNTDVMQLALAGRDVTVENLEKAYQTLSAKGLLATGKGKQGSEQEEEEQAASAIPAKQVTTTPSQTTKKSSGLKSRNPVPTKSSEPSEADLLSMPLDKLKELANKQMTGR
jgi:hypothetical protein